MKPKSVDILLIEDDASTVELLEQVLRLEGHTVVVASDGRQAMTCLDAQVFDLVITDVRLPKVDGLTIFKRVRQDSPKTKVILMSAYGTVPEAVATIKEHAVDYLAKPFDLDKLLSLVRPIAEQRQARWVLNQSDPELEKCRGDLVLLGNSLPMMMLKERIAAIARSDAPVLITGQTGTGKELVARALHRQGARLKKPFVAVNCAAFPDTLLEAELFGHERGAFTGAVRRRQGRFRAAHRGTLLLDEVVELPPSGQAKLLRVLQDGVFEPLGTTETVRVDVRIISSTNVDLTQHVELSRFREDLYYRLKVFHLHVPSLAERSSDIPLLIQYFLGALAGNDRCVPNLSERAWAALRHYPFPGNVRELQHAIEHGFVMAWGKGIDLEHLPSEIGGRAREDTSDEDAIEPLSSATQRFEREHLLSALRCAQWRKNEAAKMLGISRKTLWAKLKKHGLTPQHD